MRNLVIEHLATAAKNDERIVLLTADLGFGVVETFRDQHPDRFFNVGVSEQSMISAATGLAHMGMIPYCYSIATFASLRALEFLRNGPVAHSLPVRVIGVGPGFDYANDGLTHYAIDDLAPLRTMPNVMIWAPTSEAHLAADWHRIHGHQGLVYLRTPRAVSNPEVGRLFSEGTDVCVVSFGDAHIEASEVSRQLLAAGTPTDVFNCRWLENNPDSELAQVLNHYKVIVAVENHYVRGGFGSALLEWSTHLARPPRVVLHGVSTLPVGALGDRNYLSHAFMTPTLETVSRVRQIVGARPA